MIVAKGEREIVITRVFDAPRDLVVRAWTTPDLVSRWLGVFGDWSMAVCEIDLRVGGAFRYAWRGPKGASMGMRGQFVDVALPDRMAVTAKFDEAWYPGEETSTTTFVESKGKTTVTTTVRYESREARDGVLRSPMEQGMEAGYKALDAVLATLP